MSKMPLKILYIGTLWQGSTCLQRMHTLQELGYTVIPFDISRYMNAGSRIKRSIVHRLNWGHPVLSLNRDILKAAMSIKYDWVWIDKGVWIYPETIEALNQNKNHLAIHYTPDPAIVFHKTRHFVRSIPVYDVLITTKSYEIQKYKEYGAQHILFIHPGFDAQVHKPQIVEPDLSAKLNSDVCFIGHCEKHYYCYILAVSEIAENIAVWGCYWSRYALLHPWLKKVYRGDGIWHADYAKAICCAKIGLGFLSKLVPEQSTTRTFEIPACGTFMLGERTDEHRELFEEGKEAEFFGSDEELIDKVKYYLSHDDERKRIARAGRERCLRSGYSNHDRLKEAVDKITDLRKL